MQAERAHLRPEVAGEFIRAVDLGGDRGDAGGGEGADAVAQRIDLLAEAVVEAGDVGHQPGSFEYWRRRLPRMTLPVAVSGRLSAKITWRG